MWGKCKFRVEKFKFDLGQVEHRCSKIVEYALLALRKKTQFRIPISLSSLDSVCFFAPIQIDISNVWWIISMCSQSAILTVCHIEFTWVGDIAKKCSVYSQKNQWNNKFYQVILIQVKWSQKQVYNNFWDTQFLTPKSFSLSLSLSLSLSHTNIHTHIQFGSHSELITASE